jgi:YggT family protein
MSLLAFAIYWILQIYFYVLVGRLLLDLLISVNPSFRPKGILLPISEIIFTLTDPPLKYIRRFIKPIRFGAIALDFGWTLLVLAILLVQRVVVGLI